ncbi:hypothetical protein PISMIDRAFT_673726 [Pisolithus microcarpus 441]|uniref:Alpha/beta-hydrolase n=1 Tax=Pisolithus microcarpus 441 TaxID=765257 RepID=A0A0C9ZRF2_9AGAM|nr:hypothetical protein PISMIDRAFT_673726 [Pisolithus microcarpus 441]
MSHKNEVSMTTEHPFHHRSSSSYSRDLNKLTPKPASPLYIQKSYFDLPSRPQTSPYHGASVSNNFQRKQLRSLEADDDKEKTVENALAFPTSSILDDSFNLSSRGDLTPRHPRARTRTGPSRSKWQDGPVPPLRFSGTSSLEEPPQTPSDLSSGRGYPLDFSVVVAAPVAGVETLDALVDGMNGLGGTSMEDLLSGNLSTRSRFALPTHHPLYQPPLPTPPPGVVLGKGKGTKKEKRIVSDDDDKPFTSHSTLSKLRHTYSLRSTFTRKVSSSTITVDSASTSVTTPPPSNDSIDDLPITVPQPPERPKPVIPSISEIIRNHAPYGAQQCSRPNSSPASPHGSSSGHAHVDEEESEPEPLTADEEAEFISRSSMDSIEHEVRLTYHNQKHSPVLASPGGPRSPPLTSVPSSASDGGSIHLGVRSAASDTHTNSSSTASGHVSPPPIDPIQLAMSPTSVSQMIAECLRSARLTTLLRLTRYPHASMDNPLTVSLADMGDPNGFPLVVFLGLGCVRHIIGLYDEMADLLGLRLIAIDRWGLGRTDVPRLKSARGIIEWASAVEEVLDQLNIYECSVMAHSAGAPYAMSFANRVPERIRGDLCLLAPWIGGSESGGYRWLKYVPNGILRTAQAAEWKIQAWMLGKPPRIAYRGIGYTAPPSPGPRNRKPSPPTTAESDCSWQTESLGKIGSVYQSQDARRRMSIASSVFSDYDDLRDFDGRFGSQSTLEARSINQQRRKPSRGILGRLKSSKTTSQPPSPIPATETTSQTGVGKKLKTLRSMGSLKSKPSASGMKKEKVEAISPRLPQPVALGGDLGLGDYEWNKPGSPSPDIPPYANPPPIKATRSADSAVEKPTLPRQAGRRSISFGASSVKVRTCPSSLPSSPRNSVFSTPSSNIVATTSNSYQAALGNALIAASHAEASRGTHSDLLQILNHDNRPWGFSYTDYPHKVQVWYGDRDEKIAENAVRWMERAMGEDRCCVKVVKGADHALMYKSSVVVDVLECVREFW